jgi:hypothetical protein
MWLNDKCTFKFVVSKDANCYLPVSSQTNFEKKMCFVFTSKQGLLGTAVLHFWFSTTMIILYHSQFLYRYGLAFQDVNKK